jgi:hypothetical protein
MPKYKLRVPSIGTDLHGDNGTAIVADTIEDAREFWEDYDGEPAIYLSSYIGRCRVVHKRDVDGCECHEDAEPGDTTVDYLVDDGRELRDDEVRVWERGWQGPFSLVNRDEPRGLFQDMPPGVKVKHEVWGWGTTVARPLRHRTGWRVLVGFGGLYSGAPFPGAAGGIGGSPRWVGWWALTLTQTDTPSGRWPADRWHVDVGDERIAEGISCKVAAEALGDVRDARLRAEWEREQFDLYLAEHEKVAHA